ncbi:MAG: hypothetical protein NWR72_05535 [Bacteroidia bacterium]|nr:hypothetical protein [Bacteroidia bacterium]
MNKFLFLSLIGLLLSTSHLSAQGCVAIRHFSSGNAISSSGILQQGEWQVSSNFRYFKSFRHFRGLEEEPDRIANNSEVINHSSALDLTISYGINSRLAANFTLPYVINTRSSLYEHGRTERHSSYSRGLADSRIGLSAWLFDPTSSPKGNVSLGLGVKIPTGNWQATDIFYNVGPDGGPQTRPVDQSIQPGDGGFGATVELAVFREIRKGMYFYANGFYLSNPRETNGVRTFRETLSPLLENEAIMSVPDQFSMRAGVSISLAPSLSAGLGARYEGVPVHDLIGGSEGFRRPGNVLSVEPSLNYTKGSWTLNLLVPVAIRRNRPQSVTDMAIEQMTGSFRNGDAAFADYLINVTATYRLASHPINASPLFPQTSQK